MYAVDPDPEYTIDPRKPCQLMLCDERSGMSFLIDTGAQVSLLPPNYAQRRSLSAQSTVTGRPKLYAANGSHIQTFGLRSKKVSLCGNLFNVTFVIADVGRPILGADFLRRNNLLVDIGGQRLIDGVNFRSLSCEGVNGITAGASVHCVVDDPFERVIHEEFSVLLKPAFNRPIPAHGVYHFIPTTGAPIHSKVRRLAPEKMIIARREFEEMENLGIVRRSSSQWASPLHMVRKENGQWRPCGDFRRLNGVSVPDRYPTPHLMDFTANLDGCCIFSKIDLIKGYHQVPVAEEDIEKTAITTPFGLYEFLRMPFGLRNSAQTFQRLMHMVLRDLDFVFVYIDDILVASTSREQHFEHLRTVFKRLKDAALMVRLEKCSFGVPTLDFLGHRVTEKGCLPRDCKIRAVNDFTQPSSIKALQKFVGMVNFYHRFVPGCASLLRPLHQAMKKKSTKESLQWTEDMKESFAAAKKALCEAVRLAHPRRDAPLALTTDASDSGVGAVLEQLCDEGWQPLGFFSRQLTDAERRYSAFDRELLAIYLAIRHFRFVVEGRQFIVFTDHCPIVQALHKMADAWSARQQRHLSFISEYTTDVRHVAGKYNGVADYLSRVHNVGSVSMGVDFSALAAAQRLSEEIQQYRTALTSLQLEDIQLGGSERTLLCDVSQRYPRPVVPPGFRHHVFSLVHSLSHPGARSTRRLISQRFVWHSMNRDVNQWCRSCQACQAAKVQTHFRAPVEAIQVPPRRFTHVHVDLVGPLPVARGDKAYLLTVIDRSTRWPEAFPLSDIRAETCARAFVAGWVARFGVPQELTSDRGKQFTSALWASMAQSFGTRLHATTSYHPQSNGMVERMHRTMKAALRARLTDSNWVDELPWVLLGLRTATKEDIKCAPCQLVYGDQLVVPGEFVARGTMPICPSLPNTPTAVSHHGRAPSTDLAVLLRSKYVFVRHGAPRGLEKPYKGPYQVLEPGTKTFKLEIEGRQQIVTVDRLKPAWVDIPPEKVPVMTRAGRASVPPERLTM